MDYETTQEKRYERIKVEKMERNMVLHQFRDTLENAGVPVSLSDSPNSGNITSTYRPGFL